MTALEEIFEEIGLTQYLDTFIEQGFDTWETILDIRESDFKALGVKLGHRRKLERKIAAYRGISNTQALAPTKSASPPGTEDAAASDEASKNATPKPGKDGSNLQPSGKRKYRRHPKPDENAPERPPSAYVIFSNKMREDLKEQSLSFTEIAKLVGEHWQNLSAVDKEPYERQAFALKEKYTLQMADYRQTESFRAYAEYLADFKAKQQYQLENQDGANNDSKRPKLENLPSQASTETSKSGSGSMMTLDTLREASSNDRNSAHSASSTPARFASDHIQSPTGYHVGGPPQSMQQGYRDFNATPKQHTAQWRDQTRPIELPVHAYKIQPERKSSQPAQPPFYPNLDTSASYMHNYQTRQRSIGGYTPPLLTTESTGSTTQSSSTSGGSDHPRGMLPFYAQRNPGEMPRDRPSLPPVPAIYNGAKLPSLFEGPLPPIRHTSLSPPPSSLNALYGRQAAIPSMDYPSSRPGSQRSPYFPEPRIGRDGPQSHLMHASSNEDDNLLDPVSALIRAGEIVSNQGRQASRSQQANIQQASIQQQQQQQKQHQR